MEEAKPVKKRPVYLIVAMAFVAIALMAGLTIYQMRNGVFGDYNATLLISAKAVNLTCPQDLGDGVILDSVAAKRDLQFLYYYSLKNSEKDDETNDEFCEVYKNSIVENLVGTPDMADFGRNGVTLVFVLRDNKGETMCSVPVLPSEYHPDSSN